MEIWQNVKKKHNTGYDFPLPNKFMWAENNKTLSDIVRTVLYQVYLCLSIRQVCLQPKLDRGQML